MLRVPHESRCASSGSESPPFARGGAPLRSTKAFTPRVCRSCGTNLLDSIDYEAHGDVMRLQAAMFAAKCNGSANSPESGACRWPDGAGSAARSIYSSDGQERNGTAFPAILAFPMGM